MQGIEHEPSDLPSQFIPGNHRVQGVVIWNGIKGTLKYWGKFYGFSDQTMKARSMLLLDGKITLEEMMGPRCSLRRKKKVEPKVKYMKSGIEEVRSLL